MITAENITLHEIIGMQARILESANPQIIGLNGMIVDETKSMLSMATARGTKMIPKDINIWEFTTKDDVFTINGTQITKRSFDRIGAKKCQ